MGICKQWIDLLMQSKRDSGEIGLLFPCVLCNDAMAYGASLIMKAGPCRRRCRRH